MLRAVGITDEINACDCCGKTGLKRTVVFYDREMGGDNVYYGTTCATRNVGRKMKELNSEIKQHDYEIRLAAWQEWVETSEYKKEQDICKIAREEKWNFDKRMKELIPFCDESARVGKMIAEKHGLTGRLPYHP